ncbi:MAG TPA: trehalase-like domain-containing protein, partial [Mycobacteriales bacterium]|nr:trehalase-like domain-containing protein [Mycobacteriales bacterium]
MAGHGTPTERRDGYLPIECYAALGDGRTVALVGLDGQIDWWPLPTLDAPPAFGALLDPADGGHVALRPTGEFTTSRRYIEDTNVLETTFHAETGTVRVTDALSIGLNGLLPWEELVRKVDGIDGTVDLRWEVAPGDRLRTAQPWVEARDDSALVHIGDQHLAIRCFDLGTPDVEPHRVSGTVTVKAGDAGLLALTASDASPVMLARPAELAEHVDLTVTRWREWSRNLRYDGEWRDAVIRSALALKLLA